MIKIKKATEENLQRISEIEQEAISPPWSYEALQSEINNDDAYFIIAMDNSAKPPLCVGFAILRQVGDDAELLQIVVDKPARGRGVGDLLMNSVLKYVKEKPLESVFLEVRSSNTAAVKLYEKHGFTTVRIRKSYYNRPVEDALVMKK